MNMKDPLFEQLESLIAQVVTDLESKNVLLISPENVANSVDALIDPDNISPALKTYASIMQIRQSTRAYLRKRHDPVVKMEQEILDGTADMFSDQLQPYYPVKRDSKEGYAKLETLTSKEVQVCAGKMRSAGVALLTHSDALIAWDQSRQQAI